MANLFLPQLITWFRLDEHVRRLKGRVDDLESAPGGVQSVSGDTIDNTDPLNPIVDTPTLDQVVTAGDTAIEKTITVSDPNDVNGFTLYRDAFNYTRITKSRIYAVIGGVTYQSVFPQTSGELVTDVPNDNNNYVRKYREWILAPASTPSELQKLTETTTGWRLLGKNAANYGNIGSNAVDFSESDGASATRGATAPLSFACNYRTTASGNFAFASGSSTTASGFGAFSTGQNGTASGNSSAVTGFTCIASGDGSFATGNGNTAPSGYETVVGMFATNYSPANTNGYSALDRVFNVGNGTVAGSRSDAFTVLKDGTSIFGGPARLKTYTVVTLPAGVLGDTAIVTDATAPTYLGALVGGGAVVCPVFYNGTAWVSH